MKLSIDIDDAELNEIITSGIKGLSTETITDLAKEAQYIYAEKQLLSGTLLSLGRRLYKCSKTHSIRKKLRCTEQRYSRHWRNAVAIL